MSDALANGQKLRVLTVVDQYTRECVALEVGGHFRGQDVAMILTRVGFTRGLPTRSTSTTARNSPSLLDSSKPSVAPRHSREASAPAHEGSWRFPKRPLHPQDEPDYVLRMRWVAGGNDLQEVRSRKVGVR